MEGSIKVKMKEYIDEINNWLKNLNLFESSRVVIDDETMFLINVFGYKGHAFSIKISTFKEAEICFFGYDKEVALPLNNENLNKILTLAKSAADFGTRIEELKEMGCVYEFIADSVITAEQVKSLYADAKKESGKGVNSCVLLCSDFKGENVFKVQVS